MKHFITAFGSSVITRGIGALTMLLLIRSLPEAEFAKLSVVFGLVAAAAAMVTTPFNHIYILYRDDDPSESQAAFLRVQIAVTAALCLLGSPLVRWTGWLYPLACAWFVGLVCSEFARTFRQHRMEFGLYGLYELIRTLAILILTGFWIFRHPGGASAASFVAISAGITLLIAIATAAPIVAATPSSSRRATPPFMTRHGRAFLLLSLYFAFIAILSQTDILMLGVLAPREEVATYGAAVRYYQLLLIAMGAAYVVILPSVNQARSIEDMRGVFSNFRAPAIILVGTIILSLAAAGWLLPLLNDGRYPGAVPIFRILALSAAISIVSAPYASVLLKRRDLGFLVVLAGLALAADLALTAALIPRFGGVGAALATTICTAIVTLSVRLRARFFLAERALPALSDFPQQNPEAFAGGGRQSIGGKGQRRDQRQLP